MDLRNFVMMVTVLTAFFIPIISSNQSTAIFKLTDGECNTNSDRDLCTNCTQFVECSVDFKVISIKQILTTTIPTEIGYLTSLLKLNFSDIKTRNINLTYYTLPTEIGYLTSLTYFSSKYANNNQIIFNGTIPTEIGNLKALTFLSIVGSGLVGTIPTEVGNLIALSVFSLAMNHLDGTVPKEIGNLKLLTLLSFRRNKLNGTIPKEIGNLTILSSLYLGYNQLSGTIPKELGNLITLTSLYIQENQLTGIIPKEIGKLSSLSELVLSTNELTGSLPAEIGTLKSLRVFDGSGNQLSGSIPEEIGKLSSLVFFSIEKNRIFGPIPKEIGDLTSINIMYLGNNQLSGLPKEIGKLIAMTELDLNYNQLSAIPTEIGYLISLKKLSISNNQLTGTIPNEIGNLINLDFLSLSDSQLNGTIPIELWNLANLTELSLSNNLLRGTIPSEISRLKSIENLHLSNNLLNGTIPIDIGALTSIQYLELSWNIFSGSIPSNISLLTTLISLKLDGNSFSSPIPTNIHNLSNLRIFSFLFDDDNKNCPIGVQYYNNFIQDCAPCFSDWKTEVNYNSEFADVWDPIISQFLTFVADRVNLPNYSCNYCNNGTYSQFRDVANECSNLVDIENRRKTPCSFICSKIPNIDKEELHDIVQRISIELGKGDLISSIANKLHKVNITINTDIKQYHRSPIVDWIYIYIFKLKSYYFTLSFTQCLENEEENTIHTDINNMISKFTNKILESSSVSDTTVDISSLTNCTSIVYISRTLKNEIKIAFYTLLGVFIFIAILVAFILFVKGYFHWIIYYYKTELYFLPNEVSWSLILQWKYPYKWSYYGTDKTSYYTFELQKDSVEWNRTKKLFNDYLGGTRFGEDSIESILAIYNPTLLTAFVSKWNGMATRVEMNSSLFKKDFRDKEKGNEIDKENIKKWNILREDTYNSYLESSTKFVFNRGNHPSLVPVVHGTDYSKSRFICMTGFASLSLIDAGYYGKGIYFSSSSFYSIPYMINSLEPSLIISWIIPGNVYPVIESPGIGSNKTPSITGTSLLALPLRPGFDSHYVKTSIDGYPSHMNDTEEINYYDEFVTVQEHQILPVFILKLNDIETRKLFTAYQQEVYSLKNSNSISNISSDIEDNLDVDMNSKNDSNSFASFNRNRDDISMVSRHDLEKIILQQKQEILSQKQRIHTLENRNFNNFHQVDENINLDHRFLEAQNRTNSDFESISLINLVSEDEI